MRIGEARALLSMGFDVLMSDVDVVWRRDPRPFFSRRRDDDGDDGDGGDDGDYDASLASADVMVSSDNLSPRRDFEQGATYAARGTFNTGIVFARRTARGREIRGGVVRTFGEADGAVRVSDVGPAGVQRDGPRGGSVAGDRAGEGVDR